MNGGKVAALVLAPFALLVVGLLAVVVVLAPSTACAPTSSTTVELGALPDITDAGLSSDPGKRAEQITNAAQIMNAAAARGLPGKAQQIGVMTAMGESSLINVDYGDDRYGVTNPDGSLTCSLGLFQQQWCLGWGTREQVMDPTYAATKFYERLEKVAGWQELEPTIAAHRVQRNANPFHYAKYWDNAVKIVAALSGSAHLVGESTAQAPGTCGEDGATGAPGQVNEAGWARPAEGRYTSSFGMRFHPTEHRWKLHSGADIAAACGTDIWAANDGVVTRAGHYGTAGNAIDIDHGSGVVTRYAHMYDNGVLVKVGDQVTAGQLIGKVGSSGASTGCHLHFEVHRDGKAIDPVPYMSERGIDLR